VIKSTFLTGVLLVGSLPLAFAAGGGAAGGGATGATAGAHSSGGAHEGSSFGKPAVGNNPFPGVTARPGCVGGMAGATSTGAPSPMALPSQLTPSPTNGSAVKGQLRSTPDVPRLTQQDQRLIGEIKQANEKLGQVGNSSSTPSGDKQLGQHTAGIRGDLQRQESESPQPLPPPQTDLSAAKESTDRGLVQAKPDVSRMGEQDQRLARDIIRETEKLGQIGNPHANVGGAQLQGVPVGAGSDVRRDTNGPPLPVNTMGAASGSAC
jgi:hypothetical protein